MISHISQGPPLRATMEERKLLRAVKSTNPLVYLDISIGKEDGEWNLTEIEAIAMPTN